MTRDLRGLAETTFDVLVVGAGIYGASIAWEAAHRGLSVALIDRGDFGGGTSFNSLKTVHGGLRALQRGNLREVREFVRERRALFRIAPHLVAPLQFVIPTYGRPARSRLVMRLALAVNGLLAWDGCDGVEPARALGPGAVIGRDELLRLFPGVDPQRVTGGATWWDGQMANADRLLLAFVQSAVRTGAAAANYVGATALLRENARVTGVSARDELSGVEFTIRAHVTVNAAGGWAPALTRSVLPASAPSAVRMSQAINLVTRCPAPVCALGEAVDGQFLFCVPWRGIAIFGTWHAPPVEDADRVSVDSGTVTRCLDAIARAFPAWHVGVDDVTLVHSGLLPIHPSSDGRVRLARHTDIWDHRADGVTGLLTVVGVRYTTARATAEAVVDTAARLLGRAVAASTSATTPLAGGEIPDVAAFLNEARLQPHSTEPSTRVRIARAYGTSYRDVLSLIDRDPALEAPLSSTCPVTHAEVVYSARAEMAMRLSDALLRRTDAGSAAFPGTDAVAAAAAIMARECGWDISRTAREVDAVRARYPPHV